MKRIGTHWLIPAVFAGLSVIFAGCGRGSKASSAVDHSSADDGQAVTSVQTVAPQRRDLVVKFDQPGVVEADATTDLYPRAAGYVNKIHVDIGDTVKAGQVLLEIDVPDLVQEMAHKDALVRQARAEVVQADADLAAAQGALDAHAAQLELAEADVKKTAADQRFREHELKRYADLVVQNASTPQLEDEKRFQLGAAVAAHESAVAKQKSVRAEVAVLKAKVAAAQAAIKTRNAHVEVARADRERTKVMFDYAMLRAPFGGIITQRTIDEGAYVRSPSSDRSTPIFQLARTDSVRVVLRVPEKEVSQVRLGNRAKVKLEALGNHFVEGTVSRFSHGLDDKSRTMKVEIDVANKDGRLYPGMFGSVTLVLQEIPHALTVPATALYGTRGELFVVQVKEGKAVRTKVKTGYDDGSIVQIVEGLTGAEEVIVSNKGDLANGQAVEPFRVDVKATEEHAGAAAPNPNESQLVRR